MPQASDELRAEWNGPDDATAIKFLTDAGYKLTRGWEWLLPVPNHEPTEKEISAIQFLVDEWDFGGTTQEPQTNPFREQDVTT